MATITTVNTDAGRNQAVRQSLADLLGQAEASQAIAAAHGTAVDKVKTEEAAWF